MNTEFEVGNIVELIDNSLYTANGVNVPIGTVGIITDIDISDPSEGERAYIKWHYSDTKEKAVATYTRRLKRITSSKVSIDLIDIISI